MDCRTTLLLALTLTFTTMGCASQTGCQTCDQPRWRFLGRRSLRPPRAETCVACGKLKENQAEKFTPNPSQKQELLDQARRAYQEAIKNEPNYLPGYTSLARIYMEMNHYDKALETYHRALEKFPQEPSLWFDLGMCHGRARQWDLAVASLKRAVNLDPESRKINQTLGFFLARAGRLEESVQSLARVMTEAEAYFTVARMLNHMNQKDLCRQYLTQALQRNPNLNQARQLLVTLEGRPPASLTPNTPNSITPPGFLPPAVQLDFED